MLKNNLGLEKCDPDNIGFVVKHASWQHGFLWDHFVDVRWDWTQDGKNEIVTVLMSSAEITINGDLLAHVFSSFRAKAVALVYSEPDEPAELTPSFIRNITITRPN